MAEHDLFTVSLEKPIAALRKQDPKYAAVYTIVFSKNVTHLSTVKKQNVKLTKQQNKEEQARGGSVTY